MKLSQTWIKMLTNSNLYNKMFLLLAVFLQKQSGFVGVCLSRQPGGGWLGVHH